MRGFPLRVGRGARNRFVSTPRWRPERAGARVAGCRRGCALAATLGCALALSVSAQEALRESLAGEKAADERKKTLEDQPYNLKLGPASLDFSSSLNFQYNDNINLMETGAQQDLILLPQLNTHVFWPVTDKNALNLTLGLGYSAYVAHPAYDYLVVAPDSELSFDMFVRDFRFTFFDRFSYTENPLANGAVSGVANFGGLDNVAGMNAAWDLNKVVLSAGYGHDSYISATPQFNYMNRASELFFSRAGFVVNRTTLAGVEATGSLTTYDLSFLNNNAGYSAGVFLTWILSPHLQIRPRAGYVNYTFQTEGVIGRSGNPSTYYFNLAIDHTVNRFVSQSLEAGREVQLGTYSDFTELLFVRWNTSWKIIKDVTLGTQFFYEHGNYPPIVLLLAPGQPTYLFGDKFDRVGGVISLGYQLTRKLSTTLAYQFTLKDSADPSLSYRQNALTLGLNYHF